MITIRELLEGGDLPRETVEIKCWVKSHQTHGAISFVNVNDGSTFENLQVIRRGELDNIPIGSAVEVRGVLRESRGRQSVELEAEEIKVIAESTGFPIQKKEHSFEFLREKAHLRHRTGVFSCVNRIKDEVYGAVRSFFRREGFIWIQAPILTSNSCEGGSEAFGIEDSEAFFRKRALLSVSGQFHAEALAQGMGRVYTFGPTFRSEKSNSSHHLAEFWMIEAEAAFFTLEDNLKLMERFIKYVVGSVLENCGGELDFLREKLPDNLNLPDKLENLVAKDFGRIDYSDAVELLKKKGYSTSFGDDLNSEQERHITDHFGGPVFVLNYPKSIKAFYMKELDGRVVSSLDLLVPGVGELMGGSERESDPELLRRKAEELGVPLDGLDWYLELRNYGYHSSAGFGCGFERLVLYVTGLKNIRDAALYPRSYGQLDH